MTTLTSSITMSPWPKVPEQRRRMPGVAFYRVAMMAFRLRPPWLVVMIFAELLCSGERAGHSRSRFVVQVYFAPLRVSSFGARMATVRRLLNAARLFASSVNFFPILV